jgi:hypothetical protein
MNRCDPPVRNGDTVHRWSDGRKSQIGAAMAGFMRAVARRTFPGVVEML